MRIYSQRLALASVTGLLSLLPSTSSLSADNHPFGYFPERPQLEWQDDGRNMKLLKEFVYLDQTSMKWTSPRDATVDGASIPKILWSFVGGPFEGKYRNASIVHDTECDAQTHVWQAVHKMFYNGSRAGGVGWVKAMVMYAAVYYFGPRWNVVKKPLVTVTRDQAREYLTRLIVLLRRSHISQDIALARVENLSYDELVRIVSDDDPDLAKVRLLLAEREKINTAPDSRRELNSMLQKIDDELYLDNTAALAKSAISTIQ